MPDLLITFLASVLIWFMFIGLLVLWIIDGKIKQEQALHGLMASLIAWVVVEMIKTLVDSTRPFLLNGASVLTLTIPSGHAFPSAHAAIAFAIATTIWLHDRTVGYVFFFLAFLVGFGRVMANVHWPMDILGGAVIGIIVALIVENLHLSNLVKKRK